MPELPRDRRTWLLAGLATTAVLLMLLVQFLPWATLNANVSSVTASADADTWQASFTATGFGRTTSQSRGWYNASFDPQGGITQVRVAAPLTVLGLLGAAACVTFILLTRPRWALIAALAAAVVIALAAVLMMLGLNDLFDGKQSWSLSVWLSWTAALASAGAGLVGLLQMRRPDQPTPAPAMMPAETVVIPTPKAK